MRTFTFLLLAISFNCLKSQAQTRLPDSTDNYLNEVIINENRLQIPFGSQNRNIHILDKAQIEKLPVQSVNELLSYIGGVDVRQRGPWGAQADISIDGGTFEQVTFLINGVKMNDPQSGHNSMNIPIPVNAIERIEVLRGSAARIYGINSLTGAINIVTINPNSSGAEIQVNGGTNFKDNEEDTNKTYHSKSVQMLGRYASEIQNHLLAGSIENGSGHRYNTAFKNQKIFYQGNLSTSSKSNMTAMAGFVYNNFGANGFYAAPSDKESAEITQTGIASIGYKTKLTDRLTLKPQVNYRYSYDDYRFYRHDLSVARNQHYTHIITPELNANYQTVFGEFGFGAEARFEKINSSNIGNHKRDNLGIYTEFRTEEIKNVQISAGAYINYNSTFGWRTYPGLDLGYSFARDWKIYINSGTGQRIPSFTDLYYDTPGNIGNKNLQPENAWYVEGGFKYNNGRLWTNASYFHRKVDDFIDWVRNDTQEAWEAQNFLQNNVSGITMSADYHVTQENNSWNLLTGINYTYLDANLNKKNNNYFLSKYALESLKHQLIAKAIVEYKSFNFTLTERFQERVTNKSYFLTDVRLAYRYKNYSVYTDATNIFDTHYIEVATAPMPGRWLNLGLKVEI
jgi:iron complex outermembrane receptor protein